MRDCVSGEQRVVRDEQRAGRASDQSSIDELIRGCEAALFYEHARQVHMQIHGRSVRIDERLELVCVAVRVRSLESRVEQRLPKPL